MESNQLIDGLISQIHNIENPQKDYQILFNNAKNIFEQQNVFREYYFDHRSRILSMAGRDPRKFYDVYAFDWNKIFSPIEKYAWIYLRTAGLVLYPQFPALQYMLDFGNPYLKIALELDGKEFHDEAKDMVRDGMLYKEEGWKIFRVSGAEANRAINMPNRYPKKYNHNGWREIGDFMHNTLEGVLEALKQIYFNPNPNVFDWDWEEENFREVCVSTLKAHCLADFEIK